jgi:hypothetical protein
VVVGCWRRPASHTRAFDRLRDWRTPERFADRVLDGADASDEQAAALRPVLIDAGTRLQALFEQSKGEARVILTPVVQVLPQLSEEQRRKLDDKLPAHPAPRDAAGGRYEVQKEEQR